MSRDDPRVHGRGYLIFAVPMTVACIAAVVGLMIMILRPFW